MKKKTAHYKKQNSILKDIKTEKATLANTEQILIRRFDDLQEKLHNMEAERGIVGLTEKGKQIEQIVKEKEESDKNKEQLMIQLSEDVKKITETISKKKKELEPMIKKRKEINEELSKIEELYNQKKSN